MSAQSLLVHHLKRVRRRFLYSWANSKFPRPVADRDAQFPVIRQLRADGYARLEPRQTLQAMPVVSSLLNAYNAIDKSVIERIVEQNKGNTGRSYRKRLTTHFDRQMLLDYAEHPFLLSNIQQYFGFAPRLRFISVWLDYPTQDKALETQMFHRDPEDYRLVKTFLYLKDVEEPNGPFCFVGTSHKDPWNCYSKVRHTDEEVRKLYPVAPVCRLTGEAGTLILADTNGFHKGLKPVGGYRVLLTTYYCSENSRGGQRDTVFEPADPPQN